MVLSCVCLLFTFISPAKTAELIEIPIGRVILVSPRNRVLEGPTSPKGNWQLLAFEKHCELLLLCTQHKNQYRHQRDCCSRLNCSEVASVTLTFLREKFIPPPHDAVCHQNSLTTCSALSQSASLIALCDLQCSKTLSSVFSQLSYSTIHDTYHVYCVYSSHAFVSYQ